MTKRNAFKFELLVGLAIAALAVASSASARDMFSQAWEDTKNGVDVVVDAGTTVVEAAAKVPGAVLDGATGAIVIVGDGLKAGVDAALTPAQLGYDVLIKGESLKRAANESLDAIKGDVHDVLAMPTAITPLEQNLLQVASPVIGEDATTAVALLMLPDQILRQLPASVYDVAIKLTEGQKAHTAEDVAYGIPLDAALQSAYDYYKDKAQPLPAKVYNLLASTELYTAEQLDKVRFVVDDSGQTAPAAVNLLQEALGADNHAITIGNIIVFAKMPATNMTDINFWSHEVRHTVQYDEKGSITAFAMAYSSGHEELERDANDYGKRTLDSLLG